MLQPQNKMKSSQNMSKLYQAYTKHQTKVKYMFYLCLIIFSLFNNMNYIQQVVRKKKKTPNSQVPSKKTFTYSRGTTEMFHIFTQTTYVHYQEEKKTNK